MQTVLKELRQQQKEHKPRQQLSCEPSEQNKLIQKLKQVVAEKEAKITELQKRQQLSNKVFLCSFNLNTDRKYY